MVGSLAIAMITTLVAMGYPFSALAEQPTVVDMDRVWLARAIQGEGCHLLGEHKEEAARWMAWSIFTRVEQADWPGDLISVITEPSQYNGALTVEDPTPWAMAQADLYLAQWWDGTIQGNGPPFVLSLQDVKDMGGQVTVQGPLYHLWNGPWHLFYLWKWPYNVETSSSGSGGPGLAQ